MEAESRFSLPVINCSYRIDVNTYTVFISHFTDLACCFVFLQVYSVGPDGCSEPLSSDGPYNIETVCKDNEF